MPAKRHCGEPFQRPSKADGRFFFFRYHCAMTDAAPATSLDRLFLGRQPILDANEVLIGYELLFRNSAVNAAPAVEPGFATADVICKAFTEFGLANALAGHKAFVIADAEFLRHESLEMLPPDSVVFEISPSLADEPALIDHCAALCRQGFSFCLCYDSAIDENVVRLFNLVTFVKINLKELDDATVKTLLNPPVEHKPVPIASHIETQADHQRARDLGFHFFQGYYFAKPTLVEGKKVDPATQGLLRIINLLNHDAELNEIEQAFKNEAALTIKLLRLTNSVGIGLRVRIGSVRQAISIIGRRHIQRWLQLLLYSQQGNADIECNPLMQLAALKGNFMERLARRCYPQQAALHDHAFLAGLMSLMPALFGMAMEDILEQLAVAPPLRQALLMRAGELGMLLNLTETFDNEDLGGVERVLAQLGHRIGQEVLNQCLVESIAWVQSLSVETE